MLHAAPAHALERMLEKSNFALRSAGPHKLPSPRSVEAAMMARMPSTTASLLGQALAGLPTSPRSEVGTPRGSNKAAATGSGSSLTASSPPRPPRHALGLAECAAEPPVASPRAGCQSARDERPTTAATTGAGGGLAAASTLKGADRLRPFTAQGRAGAMTARPTSGAYKQELRSSVGLAISPRAVAHAPMAGSRYGTAISGPPFLQPQGAAIVPDYHPVGTTKRMSHNTDTLRSPRDRSGSMKKPEPHEALGTDLLPANFELAAGRLGQ